VSAATAQAIVISNPLPAQIEALSQRLAEQSSVLCARADLVTAIDSLEQLAQAEALFLEIDGFATAVHNDRMAITRRIDEFKKSIMDAEEGAVNPAKERRAKIMALASGYRRKLLAEQQAIEAKARAEAEAKAAELRRQADEKRKVDLAKWQAEEAARKKQLEEEAALGFDFDAEEAPVPLPPPPPPAPIVAVVPVVAPLVLPKSPIAQRTTRTVEITDENLIMAEACKSLGKIHGKQVLTISEKAVKEMVLAGVAVPGAKLVVTENPVKARK
jgi:hypothetical protein